MLNFAKLIGCLAFGPALVAVLYCVALLWAETERECELTNTLPPTFAE